MKCLVTGAAGFLGSHLVKRLLADGHQVVGVDPLFHGRKENLEGLKKGFTLKKYRIQEAPTSIFDKVDVVFHFGAVSNLPLCQEKPVYAYEHNVMATAYLLDQCQFHGTKKILFASSSAVYENAQTLPSREHPLVEPDLVYSMTKKHGEDLCAAFSKNYGLDITILRYFNIYGPHQDYSRMNPPLIPYLIYCLTHEITPKIYGDGRQERDFLYIDDAIEATVRAIQAGPTSPIINVGSGSRHSVNGILTTLEFLMGKEITSSRTYLPPETMWANRGLPQTPGFQQRVAKEATKQTLAEITIAQRELGWEPIVSLTEGLTECINYYQGIHHASLCPESVGE